MVKKESLHIVGNNFELPTEHIKGPVTPFRDTSGKIKKSFPLEGKFCRAPFTKMIMTKKHSRLCCRAWQETDIGPTDEASIIELFNSPTAQAIRQGVLDGSYRYCNHDICPFIRGEQLEDRASVRDPFFRKIIDENLTIIPEGPRSIAANYDASCNLACPSCRDKVFLLESGPNYDWIMKHHKTLVNFVEANGTNRPLELIITGAGDAFASKIFREFLRGFDGHKYKNVSFVLRTNGVMLTEKYWNRLTNIHDNIKRLSISVDAATEATYNIVRRGGNWKQLRQNLTMLGERRAEGQFKKFKLNFVIQQINYREIPAFIEMAEECNVDEIEFQLIFQEKHFTEEFWRAVAIWKLDHPEFNEFLSVLRHPALKRPIVLKGALQPYLEKAATFSFSAAQSLLL